jgi:hypothetical protein
VLCKNFIAKKYFIYIYIEVSCSISHVFSLRFNCHYYLNLPNLAHVNRIFSYLMLFDVMYPQITQIPLVRLHRPVNFIKFYWFLKQIAYMLHVLNIWCEYVMLYSEMYFRNLIEAVPTSKLNLITSELFCGECK